MKNKHPVCCFCLLRATETRDHIPSPECFLDGLGPDGFEFPACEKCNSATSALEQVVAFYLRLAELETIHSSKEHLDKLSSGVNNNNKNMIPIIGLTLERKKELHKIFNFVAPSDELLQQANMIELPPLGETAIGVFSRKLTCALFFREMEIGLPLENLILTGWMPYTKPDAQNTVRNLILKLPNKVKAEKSNVDFGNQFRYRWVGSLEAKTFRFLAQFGKSAFFLGETMHPARGTHEHAFLHANDDATLWQSRI